MRACGILVEDTRESVPLLVDSVLAGLPMVVFLALARAQGSEGDASAARMALTILGPVSVLGIAGRRLVYARAAGGSFGARFATLWAGVVAAVVVLCAGLLVLTRTPLYPWAFPGFEALSWVAIIGFALNHGAFFATFLSNATLRARVAPGGAARAGARHPRRDGRRRAPGAVHRPGRRRLGARRRGPRVRRGAERRGATRRARTDPRWSDPRRQPRRQPTGSHRLSGWS